MGELTASSVGFRRDLRSREEEGDVAWLVGPPRQRGKRGQGYRFGAGRCWAKAGFWSWAEWLPRVRLYIFLSFTSFSFLFFLFLLQILQKAPKQIKPLSENFTEFTARFLSQ
jgi:hypothetical protein